MLQSMEYAQTSSTVESSFVEKNTIIKTCKNNLLVDLKKWHSAFAVRRYVIARKHFIKPKTVIRPFYVIFYNCLQSFAFYKASFACF